MTDPQAFVLDDEPLTGWLLLLSWLAVIVGSWALAIGVGMAVGWLWSLV